MGGRIPICRYVIHQRDIFKSSSDVLELSLWHTTKSLCHRPVANSYDSLSASWKFDVISHFHKKKRHVLLFLHYFLFLKKIMSEMSEKFQTRGVVFTVRH